MQAAVEGVVDFTRSDRFDPRWQRSLPLLLRGLQLRNRRDRIHAEWASQTAFALWAALKQHELAQRTQERLDEFEDSLTRWRPKTEEDVRQEQRGRAKQDSEAWSAVHGDPSDPAVRQKIDALVAAMERQMEETAKQGGRKSPAAAMLQR